MNRSPTQRVAELGNALVLAALALICANAPILFSPPREAPTFTPAEVGAPASMVVLVVIDGLRSQSMRHAEIPVLSAYASTGGSRTVRLQSILPSTVAGIRGIVEGTIQPPASFVTDFRSPPAKAGGVVEAARQLRSLHIAVAGPHLWTDLYGKWIDRSVSVFGLAQEDATVLRFARSVVQDAHHQLVIAHFSGPDSIAHRFGANSPEYRARLQWCDHAIDEIEKAAPPDAVIFVTGDHGLTAGGGHGGSEPAVLETLLFCNTPELLNSHPQESKQTQLPVVLARALGVKAEPVDVIASPRLPGAILRVILFGVLTWWSIARITSAVALPENTAFLLNAAVWIALVACAWSPLTGGFLALAALVFCALRVANPHLDLRNGFAWAGVALGAVRLLDASISGAAESPKPAAVTLLVVLCALLLAGPALLVPFCSRRLRTNPTTAGYLGAGYVVAGVLAARVAGETISLSTLDVRLSFQLLADGRGLPLAILAAALRPFAFPLLFLMGILIATRGWTDLSPVFLDALRGVSSLLFGQLLFAAATLPLLYHNGALSGAGYALGLLVRDFAWITVMFPIFALVLLITRKRELLGGGAGRDFTSPDCPVTVSRR